MIRPFLFSSLIVASSVSGWAAFSCPDLAALYEQKDEAHWMMACKDAQGQLHGPFEVWTHSSVDSGSGPIYRKTTEGEYAHGARIGIWKYWSIEGAQVAEESYPME